MWHHLYSSDSLLYNKYRSEYAMNVLVATHQKEALFYICLPQDFSPAMFEMTS